VSIIIEAAGSAVEDWLRPKTKPEYGNITKLACPNF